MKQPDKRNPAALDAAQRHELRRSIRERMKKRSLRERFMFFFKNLWWSFQGAMLDQKLQDETCVERTEAQKALDRVVLETHVPHDCVTATVVRGGPCILVHHDVNQQTATIHTSYAEAADQTIKWINEQGAELSFEQSTKLSRKDQKQFAAWRRDLQTKVRLEKRKRLN